jgi:plastocyanin
MRKRSLFLPVAAVAALGVTALPAGAASSTVSLKDNFFSPKTKTISKGRTITFKWAGKAPHNVTVTKGPVKFHSTTKTSGTYKRKFTRAGTYKIVCTIHPGMELSLKVK